MDNTRLRNTEQRSAAMTIALAMLVLAAAGMCLWRGPIRALHNPSDFVLVYGPTRAWLAGENPYDSEAAKRAWVDVLSRRYAQDFEPLARRYGVIGTPEQCAEQLERFRAAGCGYFVMSVIGDPRDERAQHEAIAAEIIPRFRAR